MTDRTIGMLWGVTFVPTTQDVCVGDCADWLSDLKVVGTAHDHSNGKYYIVVEAPLDVCQSVGVKKVSPLKVSHQNLPHRKR